MPGLLAGLPIDAQTVGVAVTFLLAGMAVPTRYGVERINGVHT